MKTIIRQEKERLVDLLTTLITEKIKKHHAKKLH